MSCVAAYCWYTFSAINLCLFGKSSWFNLPYISYAANRYDWCSSLLWDLSDFHVFADKIVNIYIGIDISSTVYIRIYIPYSYSIINSRVKLLTRAERLLQILHNPLCNKLSRSVFKKKNKITLHRSLARAQLFIIHYTLIRSTAMRLWEDRGELQT